jgi:hypothetical protein
VGITDASILGLLFLLWVDEADGYATLSAMMEESFHLLRMQYGWSGHGIQTGDDELFHYCCA